MESWPQNPEFRNYPENFQSCLNATSHCHMHVFQSLYCIIFHAFLLSADFFQNQLF